MQHNGNVIKLWKKDVRFVGLDGLIGVALILQVKVFRFHSLVSPSSSLIKDKVKSS